MLKILCFGTFDGIHDGHRAMLRQARQLTADSLQERKNLASKTSPSSKLQAVNYLIVAVAPDAHVRQLKSKDPRHTSAERITMLKKERLADEVVLGDAEIGSWKILKKYKPTIIALGYDQDELRSSLEAYLEKAYPEVETEEGWQTNPKKPKIVMLSAYNPDKLHNRIIN